MCARCMLVPLFFASAMLSVSLVSHCPQRTLLPVSYPAAFFLQLLINPRQLCLVATDCDTVIGFVSAALDISQPSVRDSTHPGRECSDPCSDNPRSHITLLTLGVLSTYQRKGIGRALVHGVVQRLEASCAAAARPYSTPSDHVPHQDTESKIAVLVQVQVAQSNDVGKCFYSHLGMMDERDCDDVRLCLGPGPRTSVMAGVLCV